MLPFKPDSSAKGFLSQPRQEARRLGRNAIFSGVGTVAAYWFLGAIPLLGPMIGLAGLGFTAYQTWKWLQFRGEWGLRF